MHRTFATHCATAATALLLSACASAPQVGETPDPTPPQLMVSPQKDATGRELMTWDRPQAFGKVEGMRKVTGDTVCLLARVDLEALGYHPRAKDVQGTEMPGGGYFCAVKALGDRPAAQPPRLVRTNGILGWDRPSAFGAVPVNDKARGDAVCAKAQSAHEAVAFHPVALDEAGQPIAGGGFFCGPRSRGGRAVSGMQPTPRKAFTLAIHSPFQVRETRT